MNAQFHTSPAARYERHQRADERADKPKVLLVGQAPSRTSNPLEPFSGRSGARLVACSGLDPERFWTLVDVANLLNYWPGQSRAKGDNFSLVEARTAAKVLAGRFSIRVPRYKLIILAGRKVGAAFGLNVPRYFQPFDTGDHPDEYGVVGTGTFVVIPHPSGANYWWNQPANVNLAQRKLREWIR